MPIFRAEINFSSKREKVTSRAELKILQLELWLEPARLGLITIDYNRFRVPGKVNSVQEACSKCFAVHSTHQNLKSPKPHEKTKQKKNLNARFIKEKLKTMSLTLM